MVYDKIFFIMSIGANGPLCVSNFDRDMVGRIYSGDHFALLNTDAVRVALWSQKKIF